MKIVSARFIKSAVEPSQYVEDSLPEIAFVGKSNVGKSSLINSITQRKGLAKTSGSPGCTQLINFFTVNDRLSLVDLPGYGFAKAPEAVKRKWGPMVEAYFKERRQLRLIVFILDIRRDPGEQDLMMMQWIEFYRIPHLLVLTKIDKVSRQQVIRRRKIILNALGRPEASPVFFSVKTKSGIEELWRRMEMCLHVTS